MLVPERTLFVGRLDSVIAGSAQLVRPTKNNEAQSHAAALTTNFVAPWARGYGIGHALIQAVVDRARADSFAILNLDVRATQDIAIARYDSLGIRALGRKSALCARRGRVGDRLLLLQGPQRGERLLILYPAIDLKDGQCVRLRLGDMDQSTVFNDDPAAQAYDFVAAGCEWLHLVDLNGAFEGKPVNALAVEAILGATDIPVQLGGGIRDMATIDAWLERGYARVILGTVAVKDPDLVRAARINGPAVLPSALTPRAAKSRSKDGPKSRN